MKDSLRECQNLKSIQIVVQKAGDANNNKVVILVGGKVADKRLLIYKNILWELLPNTAYRELEYKLRGFEQPLMVIQICTC